MLHNSDAAECPKIVECTEGSIDVSVKLLLRGNSPHLEAAGKNGQIPGTRGRHSTAVTCSCSHLSSILEAVQAVLPTEICRVLFHLLTSIRLMSMCAQACTLFSSRGARINRS